MSPDPALGSLLRRPPTLQTAMMWRFLAPLLSQQLITAATGRPAETRCLMPEAFWRPRGPSSPILNYLDDAI